MARKRGEYTMTKKDYIIIAGAFQKAYAEVREQEHYQLVGVDIALEQVTDALQEDNSRFDKVKFLRFATDTK